MKITSLNKFVPSVFSFPSALSLAVAAALLSVSAPLVQATAYTYVGPSGTATDPTTGSWSTAANWLGGVVPPTSSSSSTPSRLFFGGAGTDNYISTNDITSKTYTNLVFNSTSSNAVTVTGGSFTLRNTSNVADGVGTGSQYINQDGSGAVTFGSNVAFTNSNGTFGGSGGGTVTVSGAITWVTSVTGFNVNNSGGGTFIFSGSNTTNGATGTNNFTLNNGTVDFQHINALGGTSRTIALNGGTILSSTGLTLNSSNGITLGGDVTFGGSVNFGFAKAFTLTGNRAITANTGGTTGATIAAAIGDGSNAYSLTVATASTGTLTLSGNNTYTGATVINGGTLLLGAADRIANTSAMTLSGGTFATGGFNETVGALTLSSNSIIDLGAGASVLRYSASNAITWTGGLKIYNYTGTGLIAGADVDQLFAGTDSTGLTASQLNSISFYSDAGSTLLGTGAFIGAVGQVGIVPVPEPTTVAGGALLLGMVGWSQRRNLRHMVRSVTA